MNKSVELLLQRMKAHPEEFLPPHATTVSSYSRHDSRFGQITGQVYSRKFPNGTTTINGEPFKYLEFLSDEEIEALYQGLLGICEANFYANIVDELANNNWEKDRPLREQANWYATQLPVRTHPSLAQNGLSGLGGAGLQSASSGAGQSFLGNMFNSVRGI